MGLLSCPGCGASLKFKFEQAGRRVKCPKCETPIVVPDVEDDPLFSIDTTTITPPPIMQPPMGSPPVGSLPVGSLRGAPGAVSRPALGALGSHPDELNIAVTGSAERPISSTGDSSAGQRERRLPLYLQTPPASPSPRTVPPYPDNP